MEALEFTYSIDFHSVSQRCFLLSRKSWLLPGTKRPYPCGTRTQLPVSPLSIVRREVQALWHPSISRQLMCVTCTNLGGQGSWVTMMGRQCSDCWLTDKISSRSLHYSQSAQRSHTLSEMKYNQADVSSDTCGGTSLCNCETHFVKSLTEIKIKFYVSPPFWQSQTHSLPFLCLKVR